MKQLKSQVTFLAAAAISAVVASDASAGPLLLIDINSANVSCRNAAGQTVPLTVGHTGSLTYNGTSIDAFSLLPNGLGGPPSQTVTGGPAALSIVLNFQSGVPVDGSVTVTYVGNTYTARVSPGGSISTFVGGGFIVQFSTQFGSFTAPVFGGIDVTVPPTSVGGGRFFGGGISFRVNPSSSPVADVDLFVDLDASCYVNCDGSTTLPLLGAEDFACFLNRYRAGDLRANCDGSTDQPVLGAADFTCFLSKYRAGCS